MLIVEANIERKTRRITKVNAYMYIAKDAISFMYINCFF